MPCCTRVYGHRRGEAGLSQACGMQAYISSIESRLIVANSVMNRKHEKIPPEIGGRYVFSEMFARASVYF